jgi:hypothetical protein
MKIFKLILITIFVSTLSVSSFAEEKKYNCQEIGSKTFASIAKKIWCKRQNKELKVNLGLKEKLKKLNPKKKEKKD